MRRLARLVAFEVPLTPPPYIFFTLVIRGALHALLFKSAHPPTPLPLPPRALPPAAPQHKAARTRFLLCQQCHRAAASSKRPPSPLSLPCRLSPRQRFAASSSTHETRMSMRSSRVLSSCDLCAVVQVCRGAMYRGALSHACARLRVSTCLYRLSCPVGPAGGPPQKIHSQRGGSPPSIICK